MHKTVVINVVGLTPSLIDEHMPLIESFLSEGRSATIRPSLPAVTCTVQSTYLTGKPPREHGIVGNGWYFRDECEVKFWRQSDKLVQAERIWTIAKRIDPSFTCANLFWWYAMYSGADYTVTPRPMYPADGRKLPDVWTKPPELREELQRRYGQFPLFNFWGPAASIESTWWIEAAARLLYRWKCKPTLTLIYLPHLDYVLQKQGVVSDAIAKDLRELDDTIDAWITMCHDDGTRLIILSEYGITPVSRPVHLNRVLREQGLLTVRDELGHELLDAGASTAFAVADHQLAHLYVNDPSQLSRVKAIVERTSGVARVYDEQTKHEIGLDHPRSGELVALAEPDAWFTYYYWLDESRAPDFAHTVDIHRKPGYDPAELFLDPAIKLPKAKIAWTLAKRKLGMRSLLNVIPTDATLVKGSHGLPPRTPEEGPLLIAGPGVPLDRDELDATEVLGVMLGALGSRAATK